MKATLTVDLDNGALVVEVPREAGLIGRDASLWAAHELGLKLSSRFLARSWQRGSVLATAMYVDTDGADWFVTPRRYAERLREWKDKTAERLRRSEIDAMD